MLEKLINLFKDFCAAFAMALAAYFYGKETAKSEQTETENKKLQQAINHSLSGKYTAGDAFDRMSNAKPKADGD